MKPETESKPAWIGRGIRRLEDNRLVRGRGSYMADLNPLSGTLQAAILRSPHAHANLVSIDASRALALPGVTAVLTGEDVSGWMKPLPVVADHPGKYYPIAVKKVRYVGEPVAVVVAKDRYTAEDALELIEVKYERLAPVVDIEQAWQATDNLLHEEEGTNTAISRHFTYGDPAAAFAAADATVKERVEFNRFSAMPLETYGVIANWDRAEQAAAVWCNFQGPFSMHVVMASALMLPPNKLRIIVPQDVGGGFGNKISIYPYICLLILASRKAGTPVKWIEDRKESLTASSSGTDRVTYIELAGDKDGTITAIRLNILDNVGAYIRAPEPGTLFRPFGNYTGAYKVRNVELDLTAVMTNKLPTGPNRGYSCGQLYHSLERAVDRFAEVIGMDPAEVRRRNLLTPEQFPYETPTGGYYDVGNYPAVFDKLLEASGYAKLREEQARLRREGRIVGIGLCVAVDPCSSNMGYMSLGTPKELQHKELPKSGTGEAATITMDYGGRITVTLNTAPQGQGHETVAAQIVADEIGCSPYEVTVTTGSDTATRAWTIASGAYASRFSSTAANAIVLAARKLKAKLLRVAAATLSTEPEQLQVKDGAISFCDGRDGKLSLKRLAGMVHWNPADLPDGIEPGLTFTSYYSIDGAKAIDHQEGKINSSGLYSIAADLAMIEIDPSTFELRILKYVMVHDIGRILNPVIVEGQLYGGAMHGLSNALFEELRYDEEGRLLGDTLNDYLCPSSLHALHLQIEHLETPSVSTPLGARGTGEASTMTLPAALTNAVNDALRPYGVAVNELPLTPSKLHEVCKGVSL